MTTASELPLTPETSFIPFEQRHMDIMGSAVVALPRAASAPFSYVGCPGIRVKHTGPVHAILSNACSSKACKDIPPYKNAVQPTSPSTLHPSSAGRFVDSLHLDLIYIANNETHRAFYFSPRIAPLETTPLIAYDAFGLDPSPIVSDIL